MSYYVVHAGYVTLKDNTTVYVDAGTLASYYGLVPGEYDVTPIESADKGQHVHLYPRPDAKYQNIKNEVGDVPAGTNFYSRSVQAIRRRKRRGRN